MYTHSPRIVTDGLVLALDAANVKSFRGEPTVNLGYDNGVINWQVVNLTVVTSLQTITPNLRFRIVTTDLIGSFTVGAFRMRFPLSVLSNGLTYNLSYKWRLISGGPIFEMNDWGDTSLFNRVDISYGDYNYSSASGTRATYDNTFRFMDFNMSPNSVVEIWDIQLEQRNYATPFVNGTRGTTVATGGGWADRSGNGNNGTLINGPTFDNDNLGSLVFDGVNDRVDIPDSVSLRLNGNFTISLWHRGITKTNTFPGPLFKGNSANVGGGYILFYTSVSNGAMFFKRENQQFGLTNAVNTFWSHITFTYNGTNIRGYLNGVNTYLSGTVNFTTNIDSTSLQLGRGDQFGNAAIANLSMYNRALTPQEILQNYNATKGRYGL